MYVPLIKFRILREIEKKMNDSEPHSTNRSELNVSFEAWGSRIHQEAKSRRQRAWKGCSSRWGAVWHVRKRDVVGGSEAGAWQATRWSLCPHGCCQWSEQLPTPNSSASHFGSPQTGHEVAEVSFLSLLHETTI